MILSYQNQGHTGYGECTSHDYYQFSIEEGMKTLKDRAAQIENLPQNRPEEFYQNLVNIIPDMPFLRCAIDEAYWDWYGKKHGQSTRQLLGIKPAPGKVTSYTIGIDNLSTMKTKINENPWSSYKIKLSQEHDAAFIQALVDYAEVPVCIDANASWSEKDTIHMCTSLNPNQIRFIEQPMERTEWASMQKAKTVSNIPVIADESCINLDDIDNCAQSFDGVNIKLMKCGGITPAYDMIKEARKKNLKIMIGCMTESSVGISAASQLAPLADYLDLDGALLIANDPATGVIWSSAGITWPAIHGNGVQLNLA